MSKPRRIRITHIHEWDAYYKSKDRIIGLEGIFTPHNKHWYSGYYMGYFHSDDNIRYFFMGIRYIKI